MSALRPWAGSAAGRTPFGLTLDHEATNHPTARIHLDRPLTLAPDRGRSLTYRELARVVAQTSGRLATLGVRRGDRVAIVVPNGLEILVLMYAAMRLGAIPALISNRLAPEVLDEVRARLDAQREIADPAALLDVPVAPDPPLRPSRGAEPAVIVHSSGTTGVPKLVLHSAASAHAIGYCGRFQTFGRLLPISSRDVVATGLTWTHARAALGHALALRTGMSMLVVADPHADDVARLVAEHRPTIVETHPNTFMGWERIAHGTERPFANARMFVSTADVLHRRTIETLLNASRRRFPVFAEVYGMSEMGPATVRIHRRRRPRRVPADGRDMGRPIPGFSKVRVVDPSSGRPLPRGARGAIEFSTSARLLAYIGQPERFLAAVNGDWFRTGDLGVRARSGQIRLCDRAVDHVPDVASCILVEDELLRRLPQLDEVVVVRGVDDRATPVVVTADDAPLDRAAWNAAVRPLLVRLAEPVHVAHDRLPQTGTTKVRRFLVREMLASGRDGAVTAEHAGELA